MRAIVLALINEGASLVLQLLFDISNLELGLIGALLLPRSMQLVLRNLSLALRIWRDSFLPTWPGHLLPTTGLTTLDLVAHDTCETLFKVRGADGDFRVIKFTFDQRVH